MLFVTLFTPEYAEEARGWKASADALGLDVLVVEARSTGSWVRNGQLKAEAVLKAPKPCVWVDADARFRSYPDLFDTLTCRFAAHWKTKGRGRELLSGTLFFGQGSEPLIQAWIDENEHHPDRWDQKNLQAVIERKDWEGIAELPASYCLIFDSMADQGPAVIEHLQASRRLKRAVNH